MKICEIEGARRKADPRFFEAAGSLAAKGLGNRGHSWSSAAVRRSDGRLSPGGRRERRGDPGIAPRFFDEPGILFPAAPVFFYRDHGPAQAAHGGRERGLCDSARRHRYAGGVFGDADAQAAGAARQAHGGAEHPGVFRSPMPPCWKNAADGGFHEPKLPEAVRLLRRPEEAVQYVESAEILTGSIRRSRDYSK